MAVWMHMTLGTKRRRGEEGRGGMSRKGEQNGGG